MGTFTNFIKLHKPGETEKYNINVFNANAELIDSALARMEQENENRDNLLDTLKTKATDLVDGLLSKEDHAKYEDANNKKHTHNNKAVLDGITATLVSAWNTVTNKVDKVAGKGLSTHDYTTEEKNKLNGIESGAKANVQADWNVSDTDSDAYIKNKPDLTAYAPSVMTGATADAAGRAGSVPAPAKGKQNAFLRGDGTWQGTSTSLTATVPGIPLDQTAGKALKDQLDAQNNNLSELGGQLQNLFVTRIVSKSITVQYLQMFDISIPAQGGYTPIGITGFQIDYHLNLFGIGISSINNISAVLSSRDGTTVTVSCSFYIFYVKNFN